MTNKYTLVCSFHKGAHGEHILQLQLKYCQHEYWLQIYGRADDIHTRNQSATELGAYFIWHIATDISLTKLVAEIQTATAILRKIVANNRKKQNT